MQRKPMIFKFYGTIFQSSNFLTQHKVKRNNLPYMNSYLVDKNNPQKNTDYPHYYLGYPTMGLCRANNTHSSSVRIQQYG